MSFGRQPQHGEALGRWLPAERVPEHLVEVQLAREDLVLGVGAVRVLGSYPGVGGPEERLVTDEP
ncbi:hypothetical protein ACGFIV_15605 [Sphaerisporangium sp. NPDC049003]|uniref:hypothetical protein n=1 Tax=Sphaerisporangium sp. NPDC049003 TaxID=3364517 RepID=UPI00371A1E55